MGVNIIEIADETHIRAAETRDPALANLYPEEIMARIPAGCEALARAAILDPMKRQYVEKNYSVTLSSGVGTVEDAEDFLYESLETSTVTKTGVADPLVWVGDRAELMVPRYRGYLYYTREGTNILTCDLAGSLSGLTGSLDITNGVFVPVVTEDGADTTLHARLKDDLIGYLIELMLENLGRRKSIAPSGGMNG